MWFIKKIFWMLIFPFVALTGVLMFAFPEEMKEFKILAKMDWLWYVYSCYDTYPKDI